MFEDPPSFKRRSPSQPASWNQYLATGVLIGITNSGESGGPSIKRLATLMKEPRRSWRKRPDRPDSADLVTSICQAHWRRRGRACAAGKGFDAAWLVAVNLPAKI